MTKYRPYPNRGVGGGAERAAALEAAKANLLADHYIGVPILPNPSSRQIARATARKAARDELVATKLIRRRQW